MRTYLLNYKLIQKIQTMYLYSISFDLQHKNCGALPYVISSTLHLLTIGQFFFIILSHIFNVVIDKNNLMSLVPW